jgi:endonuclease YncB( thermonuclease family)
MSTPKKIVLTLCGSVLVAATLFNSLRLATLTRQVQNLEDSQRVVRPEVSHLPPVPFAAKEAPADGSAHKVLRVVDGDTVEIETESQPLKVRVIGIDTPETVHPSKPIEPGGPEATAKARELLEGQTVILHYDPDAKHDRWDKYRRLLAYLELADGRDFGLVMVTEGYAVVYTKYPFSRQASYLEAAPQSARPNEETPDSNEDPNERRIGLSSPMNPGLWLDPSASLSDQHVSMTPFFPSVLRERLSWPVCLPTIALGLISRVGPTRKGEIYVLCCRDKSEQSHSVPVLD